MKATLSAFYRRSISMSPFVSLIRILGIARLRGLSFPYSVRLFLLTLFAVTVYSGTVSAESLIYDNTIPSGQLYYFNNPYSVAVDASGNVYVTDPGNQRIQKYNSGGVYLSTLGVTGVAGTDNSHFYNPLGVAVDGSGNVYVADTYNHRIQKYNSSGVYLSTLGVTGVIGSDNSHFYNPLGVAMDGSGNVYVADTYNHRIQKYDSSGIYISTLGVSGVVGSDNSHFNYPLGVTVDGSGNVYVSDHVNQRIQKYDSNGAYISTLGVSGVVGSDNSHFNYPRGVTVDGSGNVYVADQSNQRIQKYNSSGVYLSTLGATGVVGTDNSHFYNPLGVAVDGLGNVYVADSGNNRIQKYNSIGAFVSTWGSTGSDNNLFNSPYSVAVDGSGNVYVADTNNQRIQKYNSSGVYLSTLGVTGVAGSDNSHFFYPRGVAVDGSGNVYVADTYNQRIQKYDSNGTYISTLGVSGVAGSDNSHFNYPFGVTVDGSGNVYVADQSNHRIQKYDSNGAYISTLGVSGVAGSDNSHFNYPFGVTVDGSGNIFVADQSNQRIQKYNSSGIYLSTLGVTGVVGSDNSHFFYPYGMAVDGSGNVYVADQNNQRIQKYNSNGTYISTLGVSGVAGSDNSHFNYPRAVAVDGSGNVYVADTQNQRIQKFRSLPVADASIRPNPSACSQLISFDASGSTHPNPNKSIVQYNWNFGDGSAPAGGISLTHLFSSFGTYTVTLTVTDNTGDTGTATKTVNVNLGNHAPIANTGGPYATNGNAVTFNASGSTDPDTACGDSIVSYQWDLNNAGAYDITGMYPSVSPTLMQAKGISSPGTYSLLLRVGDSFGATNTTSTNIVFDNTSPTTTASPGGGAFTSTQNVTLSCNDGSGSGCTTKYYCLGSGCTPTSVYSGSIAISTSQTLRYYSLDAAGNIEVVKTAVYLIENTLAITKFGIGTGTITPDSGTIAWSGNSGSTSYNSDTVVTLTAAPDSDSRFAGWSGTCSGTGTCTVTMEAGKNVGALFVPLASSWPMRQHDMYHTGRADFSIPLNRLNDTFFDALIWQKLSPGGLSSSTMSYFDGVGPAGADIVVGGYHWPKGFQGMDRHTGNSFWTGNTSGGESSGVITPAFSSNGQTIYVTNDATAGPTPLMAFRPTNGPSSYWHNGADPNPLLMGVSSPTIAPDGRIFLPLFGDRPFAAADSGTALTKVWSADKNFNDGYSKPALYQDGADLKVIVGGRTGSVKAFNGGTVGTNELWSVNTGVMIDADPTVDPANGHIYLGAGDSSIYAIGLDANGNNLWSSSKSLVYTYSAGVNNPQRAQSSGCLSFDGATYYFQTVGQSGNGVLYAINTSDGSIKWSYNTASQGWEMTASSPIVFFNGVIVVGNNDGGNYFALKDDGTHATLFDTLPVDAAGNARSSATVSADGSMYLPLRTFWKAGNGGGDTPTNQVANLFTAFDLTGGGWPPQRTLTINLSGSGAGNITADTGSIEWNGNSGTVTSGFGSTVSLTATSNSGSIFYGWSGACSGNGTCQIAMNAAKSVTATFADSLAPTTTATPAGGSYSSTQNVNLSCSDGGGSGCSTTYYCFGNDCTPDITYSSAIAITASQTLRFFSMDTIGNSEAVKTAIYTIDPPVNGACGSSHAAILTAGPSDTCSAGLAFFVSGNGPWNWTCHGVNGGADAACVAYLQGQPAIQLPQTGQTICSDASGTTVPCSGTGQDGNIRAGEAWPNPRFTDNSAANSDNQTVTDNLTGLIWSKDANLIVSRNPEFDTINDDPDNIDGAVYWPFALDYIKKLNTESYLGFNDWRLPNKNELASLMDLSQNTQTLPLGHPFTNVKSLYWSSTTFAYDLSNAWYVWLDSGSIGYNGKTNNYNVWPVRGGQSGALTLPKTGQANCYTYYGEQITCSGTGQDGELQTGATWPNPRFIDNSLTTPSNLTVNDNLTGLIWSKSANPAAATKTWSEALYHIKTLNSSNYLGYNDWRLPNRNELATLMDSSLHNPALPSGYPFIDPGVFYWSSSSSMNVIGAAWSMNLRYGNFVSFSKSSSIYFWPVRGGHIVKSEQTIGTITFSPAILRVSGTTMVNATATSGLSVTFASTTPAVCTVSGTTVTGVTAGTCSISANQTGNAYYNAASQAIQSIVIDGAAPTTTATPGSGTFTSIQNVTLTCNDGSGSGCATKYYCLGSGCTPGTVYGGAIAISSSQTLRYFSIDNAGNSEAVKTAIYVIDGTPPTTTATPAGGIFNTTQNVTLSCNDGSGSGCATKYYCLGSSCTPGSVYSGAIVISSSQTLRYFSTDMAGNVEEVKTTAYSFTDLPIVTAFSVPPLAKSRTILLASFTASVVKPINGYRIALYPTPPLATTTGWLKTKPASFTVKAAGSNTLYAWVKDSAGNISEAANATVNVDLTKPVVTAFKVTTPVNSMTIQVVSFTAADDNSGVAGFLITESAIPPWASASGWSRNAPLTYTTAAPGNKTLYAWALDNAGNVSLAKIATCVVDLTRPVVTLFTLPAVPLNSLTIPVARFTATDNVKVAGYQITESLTAPDTDDSNWKSAAPTSYLLAVGTAGDIKTLYAWAKDTAGNVSLSSSAAVTLDYTPPKVDNFTIPPLSKSRVVPVTTFTVSDNIAVAGYRIALTPTPPLVTTTGWLKTKPATFSVKAAGSNTLYAWVKDSAGNISAAASATVNVDLTKPVVTAFKVTTPVNSMTIQVTSFTADDNSGVASFLITESAIPPWASASEWSRNAPLTYTTATPGNKTLYAWALDNAGNVSLAKIATCVVDLTRPVVTLFTLPAVPLNSLTIPVARFTATDNVKVAGYQITEILTAPDTDDSNWKNAAPTSYLLAVGTAGDIKTLYAWVKDTAGNVSLSSSAAVTLDYTPPKVDSFAIPPLSKSRVIPVTTFTVSDNITVAGYRIALTPTPPLATTADWLKAKPASFSVKAAGSNTLYAWVKDSAGNISAAASATVNVDLTKPVVTAFKVTTPINSMTIQVTSFTADDDNSGVAGFLITESVITPWASASGWSRNAPLTYTTATPGNKTLYAWALDNAGNVSLARSAAVKVQP